MSPIKQCSASRHSVSRPPHRTGAAAALLMAAALLGCGDAHVTSLAATGRPDGLTAPNLPALLASPLIVGASVSADRNTISPGKRLSLKYTTADQITTVAEGGNRAPQQVRKINPALLAGKTIIFGIDLFYWDTLDPRTGAATQALRDVIEQATPLPGGIVLATVPHLVRWQFGRPAVNNALRSMCTEAVNCHLYDLDRRYQEVTAAGGLDVDGTHYPVSALTVDGRHLTEVGSRFMALELEALLAHGA